jgi:hypothetical protein
MAGYSERLTHPATVRWQVLRQLARPAQRLQAQQLALP